MFFTVGGDLGAQAMRTPTKDEVRCKISKEMSSLYFGLAVFCLFEARGPEFGTQPLSQDVGCTSVQYVLYTEHCT